MAAQNYQECHGNGTIQCVLPPFSSAVAAIAAARSTPAPAMVRVPAERGRILAGAFLDRDSLTVHYRCTARRVERRSRLTRKGVDGRGRPKLKFDPGHHRLFIIETGSDVLRDVPVDVVAHPDDFDCVMYTFLADVAPLLNACSIAGACPGFDRIAFQSLLWTTGKVFADRQLFGACLLTAEDRLALINMRLMVLAVWVQLRVQHRHLPPTALLRSFFNIDVDSVGQQELVSHLFDAVEQAACLRKSRHRIMSGDWAHVKAARYFYRLRASDAHSDFDDTPIKMELLRQQRHVELELLQQHVVAALTAQVAQLQQQQEVRLEQPPLLSADSGGGTISVPSPASFGGISGGIAWCTG